ncbi:copper-translocating P-type ATPase [Salibacterium aidingense]|uniref:copper-translocating P-type ATPase n=1 Tax=Salibacterium aidingense TaxID=384933 RepID=UPI000416A8E2|nr:copper-translocating P-type ATPase [Salibacterium aidingense]
MAEAEAHHHHHEQHHGHDKHEHHGHEDHDHGAMIDDFKRRFYVSLGLTIPIMALSPMIQEWMGVDWNFSGSQYLLFVLATVVFVYGGKPFLTGAWSELKGREPGMMTLIAFAIVVAYGYSTLTVFGLGASNFYWELATLITIMLVGHWVEMRSIQGASSALEELVKLMPSEAHRLDENGDIHDAAIEELEPGDHVLVRPGEKIPADGTIVKGASTVDESMITGESIPVEKTTDDTLIAGAINKEGSLTLSIEKTGSDSYLSQVVDLVKKAQQSKSRAQNFSDRAAKWLFYIALGAGLLTLIVWLISGFDFAFALERMVTVMVIACPHALGLAIPLVVSVSTSLSAQKGLFIRNRTQFEEARRVDAILFDKTGTLTKGSFGVTDVVLEAAENEEEVLRLAAALENESEHPLARGIVEAARERGIDWPQAESFENLTGKGLQGTVEGRSILIVSPGYAKDEEWNFSEEQFQALADEGKTVIFVAEEKQVLAMIALADQIRESSFDAVKRLKEMGIEPMMLTGDNQKVAHWVGRQLGLDSIYAEVLPDEKAAKVKELQHQGYRTAMTGDGINDAPALAAADLGIAVGAGTDVAMETADVVLVESDPEDVVSILELSEATSRKMKQNLWWAAGYNIIAIPLAAGVLYSIGVLMNPAVGAVLMSLSTIIVAINARLLRLPERKISRGDEKIVGDDE